MGADDRVIEQFINDEHRLQARLGAEEWERTRGPEYRRTLDALCNKYGLSLHSVLRSGQALTIEDGEVSVVRKSGPSLGD